MSRTFAVLLLSLLIISVGAAEPVKRSNSLLCHTTQSAYYSRIQHYEGFPSLGACLASGGRLPASQAKIALDTPAAQTSDGYQRAAFGAGWDDQDQDCQDSRAEALIATSTTPVRFADVARCRVISGRWISPFTGAVIQNAGDIDIDHVVPLAWAWHHGANEWSEEHRVKFANDPINHWPVEARLNRSKGAHGPDTWLPPRNHCQYAARFLRIAKNYELALTPQEKKQMRQILDECRGLSMEIIAPSVRRGGLTFGSW